MKTNTTPSNGFRIYSNDAEYPPSENVLVLAQNTPEDQFVASLKDKCITLSRRPATNTYTTVDSQDRWMAWLENFGHDCECSLMVDPSQAPDKALQCFRFSIETPWGQAKFDSSSTYLQSAFGKEPAAFVQSPGVVVMTTGPVLHCGLVKPSLALKPTVEQLFKFAEQEGTIKNLPYGIPELTGVLNASNYSGVRNALWFDPVFFPNTNIQLRFQLNSVRELQDVFTELLPGFQITEAEVICKKKGNAEGRVGFAASCNIKTKDEQVNTMAYIHFTYSNVTLTLKPVPGKINQILEWLKDVVGLSPASIRAMFGPKTIFHGLDVQSLMIDFSLDRVNDDPGVLDIQLSYMNLKVEVIANFGKVDDKEPVFLVTYIWRGPTDSYMARGRLWTSHDPYIGYNDVPQRPIRPGYEPWDDLYPHTKDPASAIDLQTLIPGHPRSMDRSTSQIDFLYVRFSEQDVSFTARVAFDGPKRVHHLNAGYRWEDIEDYKFEYRCLDNGSD